MPAAGPCMAAITGLPQSSTEVISFCAPVIMVRMVEPTSRGPPWPAAIPRTSAPVQKNLPTAPITTTRTSGSASACAIS